MKRCAFDKDRVCDLTCAAWEAWAPTKKADPFYTITCGRMTTQSGYRRIAGPFKDAAEKDAFENAAMLDLKK